MCVCVCVHPSEAEDEDEENDDEDDDAEEASAEKGRKPTLLERTGSVSACDSGILFSRSQPRLCSVCLSGDVSSLAVERFPVRRAQPRDRQVAKPPRGGVSSLPVEVFPARPAQPSKRRVAKPSRVMELMGLRGGLWSAKCVLCRALLLVRVRAVHFSVMHAERHWA